MNQLVSKYVEQFLSRLEPTQLAAGLTQELRKSAFAFARDECGQAILWHRGMILQYILDELRGFGPLERLLQDKEIQEIHVYSAERILVRKTHTTLLTQASFTFLGSSQYDRVLQRLLTAKDELGNITLIDGTRFNIEFTNERANAPHFKIHKILNDPIY
ncbi:MAG: hypothetical protein P4L53_25390 [Candidatus Obscuribacterales bacterium]|nr:hypothetical protein [Candidatus Obscuribacterales bacterium]